MSSQSSDHPTPTRKPANPTLTALEKPLPLSKVLEQDAGDCVACRVTGSLALFGVAGYIFLSGRSQLRNRAKDLSKKRGVTSTMGIRMMGLGTLSGAFVAMGIYRLIN